ncbi:MAG: hypothetical protein ACPHRO_12940, partial [Nannocystaceae bacterium]
VPDHPDVLDVPLRALLSCVALSWMFDAGLSYALDGEAFGKASMFISALVSVGLLTLFFHPISRLFRGIGTWRQSAATSCVLMVAYAGFNYLVLPALEWSFEVDATNPAAVASYLGNADLEKIQAAQTTCHRQSPLEPTHLDTRSTSFCGHVSPSEPAARAADHPRCDAEAIAACAALEDFNAADCARAFDAHHDPALVDRWLQWMSVDIDTHETLLRRANNTVLFVAASVMFWLLIRLFGSVHGFSMARSLTLFGLLGLFFVVLLVGVLLSGALDMFDPLLEALDALS